MCESQLFAHWCTAQKSFMIASTEGEMDMFRRSPKFLLHLTKEEYDLIVYSMINRFCKKCWGGGYLNIFQSPFLFKK